MNYPISLRFKKLTLTNETRVLDASGQEIGYVKQKLLRFKEEIQIFADNTQTQLRYTIKADKIIDWSPTYTLSDATNTNLGTAKRQGARSLFKSTYNLQLSSGFSGTLRETNPWVKFIDGFIGEIPIIGLFSGYFINPSYEIRDHAGKLVAELTKKPAFFEGHYDITPGEAMLSEETAQTQLTMLIMLVAFMERYRG